MQVRDMIAPCDYAPDLFVCAYAGLVSGHVQVVGGGFRNRTVVQSLLVLRGPQTARQHESATPTRALAVLRELPHNASGTVVDDVFPHETAGHPCDQADADKALVSVVAGVEFPLQR